MFFGLFKPKPTVVKVQTKNKPKKRLKRSKIKKTRKVKIVKRTTLSKRKKAVVKKFKALTQPKTILKPIGEVTHYFPHVQAGVILIKRGTISLGDTLYIKGHTTDFKQKVTSIQINNVAIKQAKAGQEIGLLVKSRLRHNDLVYKV